MAQINMIKLRLHDRGYTKIEDEQIHYALSSKHANGDLDKAFEMMVLFQESVEGIIKPYNPAIHMRGAENREFVTCYLDALLFAMFARLGSFEPILYTDFEDEHRRRLSTLIRLWVNMLRTGKFIQTDVVRYELSYIKTRANGCRLNICRKHSQSVAGKMPLSSSNRTLQKPSISSPRS